MNPWHEISKIKEENEIWAKYTGEYKELHNLVWVSSLGRVWKLGTNTRKNISGLVGNSTVQGYVVIRVSVKGKAYTRRVHRLVAETFIENPDNKPYVDHVNAKRDDNRAENLRWVTHSENMRNPHYTKILSKRSKEVASNNYMGEANKKKVVATHIEGNKLYFGSIKELCEYFGITSLSVVSKKINSGKYAQKNSLLRGWKVDTQ